MTGGGLQGLFAPMPMGRGLGEPLGETQAERVGTSTGSGPQVNSLPMGALTGAPPRVFFRTVQIKPISTGEPTLVVLAERQSRSVTLISPLVGFPILFGGSDVGSGGGIALPAGLPYDFLLPGGQEIYAVVDGPIYLPLRVQIAALLIGDRERRP